jgi:transposase-like protein
MSTYDEKDLRKRFRKLTLTQRLDFVKFAVTSVQDQIASNTNRILRQTLNRLIPSKENKGLKCPKCRSRKFIKHDIRGKKIKVQRYRCKKCGKVFSSLAKTFLKGTKKDFKTWRKFINCMKYRLSTNDTARICKIHRNTVFVWRSKILNLLSEHQKTVRMKGIVEMDDTYFKPSFKGSTPKGRPAHHRGTPAKKRGVSKEKVSVICLVDHMGQVYSKVCALGQPTASALEKAIGKELFPNKNKRTKICTDGAKAFPKYAADNHFEHIRIVGAAGRRGKYNSQSVNSYHSWLKDFISGFRSVSTKYLDNYLVWFNVIHKGQKSRMDILEICMNLKNKTKWNNVRKRPAMPVLTSKRKSNIRR